MNAAALTRMLRVMVLHGAPPESLAKDLAPPFQRIVHDGARLRARLPARPYRRQGLVLLDTHCPLLLPLQDLVHGYEVPTTSNEFWATVVGAPLQRALGQSREVSLLFAAAAKSSEHYSLATR
jgi:hypothetical protein